MPTLNVDSSEVAVDRAPNDCPICHHAIEPRHFGATFVERPSFGEIRVDAVFKCPQRDCNRLFIGTYRGHRRGDGTQDVLQLRSTAPYTPPPPITPPAVAGLSPQFVKIYAQASAAEAFRLDQVAGCGYRKALEFLIKDFCVAEHPTQAEAIKTKLLGQVIKDHVADVGVKECARRASWLGNDETHYVRLWEDNDLEDLKTLIALTVSWINTVLLTKSYLKAMPG